ncbi:hypothetical protein GTW69_01040, partial [Streptomyces sp. SID7760]|nr:hypothetical protein [Streptomyces sp. SID7760]
QRPPGHGRQPHRAVHAATPRPGVRTPADTPAQSSSQARPSYSASRDPVTDSRAVIPGTPSSGSGSSPSAAPAGPAVERYEEPRQHPRTGGRLSAGRPGPDPAQEDPGEHQRPRPAPPPSGMTSSEDSPAGPVVPRDDRSPDVLTVP